MAAVSAVAVAVVPAGWARWRAVHEVAVLPACAVVVPAAPVVVRTPVAAECECDDRDADARAVVGDVDALAFVFLFQVGAGDPAAVRAGDDVAPFPAVDAALHGYFDAGGQ